uniref:(northern house mosquito) hypothetical protein n=1 Tax=Culex pipiens TaxID=7175 RepID=A0A8D8MMK5_CULPI
MYLASLLNSWRFSLVYICTGFAAIWLNLHVVLHDNECLYPAKCSSITKVVNAKVMELLVYTELLISLLNINNLFMCKFGKICFRIRTAAVHTKTADRFNSVQNV